MFLILPSLFLYLISFSSLSLLRARQLDKAVRFAKTSARASIRRVAADKNLRSQRRPPPRGFYADANSDDDDDDGGGGGGEGGRSSSSSWGRRGAGSSSRPQRGAAAARGGRRGASIFSDPEAAPGGSARPRGFTTLLI